MTDSNFKPIICQRCGSVVWEGVSWAGFNRRLDMTVLTVEEEIIKRLTGHKTYQLHKTHISFEAIERSLVRIQGDRHRQKIVLADHRCSGISVFATIESAPNYWPSPVKPSLETNTQGAPF